MSNFIFLINLDNNLRISNYENNLIYDKSYMSYFKNSTIEEAIFIVKNTLIKKILEKQIVYKNEEQLYEINNCLDYIIKNLNSINDNKIYNDNEMKLLTVLVNDIVKYNNEANEYISKSKNKDVVIVIEEENSYISNSQDIESQDIKSQDIESQDIKSQDIESQEDNQSIFSNTCLIQDENKYNNCICNKKSLKYKIYSISIKVKNYIKTGFKKVFNFFYSRFKKK